MCSQSTCSGLRNVQSEELLCFAVCAVQGKRQVHSTVYHSCQFLSTLLLTLLPTLLLVLLFTLSPLFFNNLLTFLPTSLLPQSPGPLSLIYPHDQDGAYTCVCKSGYFGDGFFCRSCTPTCPPGTKSNAPCGGLHDLRCEDVDECETGTPCHESETCVNTYGSYRCDCGVNEERNAEGGCVAVLVTRAWMGQLTSAQAAAIKDTAGGYSKWETVRFVCAGLWSGVSLPLSAKP